jgi:hypothetical protein
LDRLKERIATAERALRSLEDLAGLAAPTRVERDAAIQRFPGLTNQVGWSMVVR